MASKSAYVYGMADNNNDDDDDDEYDRNDDIEYTLTFPSNVSASLNAFIAAPPYGRRRNEASESSSVGGDDKNNYDDDNNDDNDDDQALRRMRKAQGWFLDDEDYEGYGKEEQEGEESREKRQETRRDSAAMGEGIRGVERVLSRGENDGILPLEPVVVILGGRGCDERQLAAYASGTCVCACVCVCLCVCVCVYLVMCVFVFAGMRA